MSGGHWNYQDVNLTELLVEISDDTYIIADFPSLTEKLTALGKVLEEVLHDLDWHVSGDTCIDNKAEFQVNCINKLRDSLK